MTSDRGAAFFPRGILFVAIALALCAAPAAGRAPDGSAAEATAGTINAKGYLIARYVYVGSSSPATVYSAIRFTGFVGISALSDRIAFRFRSHRWVHFERTDKHVLESPFTDRTILHTVSLATDGLLLAGLKAEIGRFFPELDYGSVPPIDGGALSYESHGLTAGVAAGRSVDTWNGDEEPGDPLGIARLRFRNDRFTVAAGYQRCERSGIRQRELPAGVSVSLGKGLRIEAYGGYDFSFKEYVRSGLSLSWHADRLALSLAATRWRNPYDQLALLDKGANLPYWGVNSPPAPSNYDDARLSCSYARGGWRTRGTVGFMGGVRSGWTANAYLTPPPFFGFVVGFGGQGMQSDFVEFYSLDASLDRRVGACSLRLETQTRNYDWRPGPSSLHITDNYSEISVEYPLGRHFFLGAEAGGFFRALGDERFKPEVSLQLRARI